MTYTYRTRLDSAPQGGWSRDAVERVARARGAKRLADLRLYLDIVYAQVFLNPEIVAIQSAHETGWWTSGWWEDRCNPAGIGITGTPAQDNASRDFENGSNAARAHLAHLALYHYGPRLPGGFPAGRVDDPRWDAAIDAGYAGNVHTLGGLTGTWAEDDRYDVKLVGILNEYPTDAPAEGTPDMAVRFEKRIARNRLGETAKLRDILAWFTIHENGNTGSSPFDEAAFVNNGGGRESVLYHFSVGVEDDQPIIVQIYPMDRRGKHAGNSNGNATSGAVETCQAPPGATSDLTQEALRELLYMVYTHDPRIDWGDGGYEFAPDRTCGHKDWPGANPGCPQYMTRQWGGVEPVVEAVRRRLTNEPAPEPVIIRIGDTLRTLVPLNLRMKPGTDEPVVTTLPAGTDLVVTGKWSRVDGYGWFPVSSAAGSGVVAQGDANDPYVALVVRAPEPEPEPAPDVAYPRYLTGALASHLFGSVTIEGVTYAYNPVGPVSQLWLERGKATGQYPRLTEMFLDGGHKYFVFGDGAVVVDPEGADAPQYVGTVDALIDAIGDALDAA